MELGWPTNHRPKPGAQPRKAVTHWVRMLRRSLTRAAVCAEIRLFGLNPRCPLKVPLP